MSSSISYELMEQTKNEIINRGYLIPLSSKDFLSVSTGTEGQTNRVGLLAYGSGHGNQPATSSSLSLLNSFTTDNNLSLIAPRNGSIKHIEGFVTNKENIIVPPGETLIIYFNIYRSSPATSLFNSNLDFADSTDITGTLVANSPLRFSKDVNIPILKGDRVVFAGAIRGKTTGQFINKTLNLKFSAGILFV